MARDIKRRFWVSLVVSIPVLIISPEIQSFFGVSMPIPGDRWFQLALSSFIFFYGGMPFIRGMVEEIREKLPGMMTLIGTAVSIAYGYSALVVFWIPGKIFFWELATLIDIMLLGHWIEMRSAMGASRALEEMAELMPLEAHRVAEDGVVRDVRVKELKKGDRVLVRPGEKIPADGVVTEGESDVNESMITGESKPADRGEGEEVIGGSVNGTGALTVEVTKTGEESYLARVMELVRAAGESKSRAQNIAGRAAFWLTVIALSAGVITLAGWLVQGFGLAFSLERMVTVMVIACPCALGLAVPLVVSVITALAAGKGILIRNRTAFEEARLVDTVVFDKTGTLTRGEFGVTDLISTGKWSRDELLRRAASVESGSEHTIARGIVKKAGESGIEAGKAERFTALPGKGAKGRTEGMELFVGNRGILAEAGLDERAAKEVFDRVSSEGKTAVLVATADAVQGVIGLADGIRDESREAVRALRERGLEVAMITGDNETTAARVAGELGIDAFFAGVLPDNKSERIRELQKKGRKVAMVGDGVNDAPALAAADVGIAIGAGTDVAAESADVVLVDSDPRKVKEVLSLSRITRRKMAQNLAWATAYNIVAIPVAAGMLSHWGIVLPPAAGAVAMSASSVIVAINARMIR